MALAAILSMLKLRHSWSLNDGIPVEADDMFLTMRPSEREKTAIRIYIPLTGEIVFQPTVTSVLCQPLVGDI